MNKVSEEEFNDGLEKTYAHFDTHQKGYLNKEDISRIIAASYRNQESAEKVSIKDEMVEKVYAIFDRDHSGSVTYEEFGKILAEKYYGRRQ